MLLTILYIVIAMILLIVLYAMHITRKKYTDPNWYSDYLIFRIKRTNIHHPVNQRTIDSLFTAIILAEKYGDNPKLISMKYALQTILVEELVKLICLKAPDAPNIKLCIHRNLTHMVGQLTYLNCASDINYVLNNYQPFPHHKIIIEALEAGYREAEKCPIKTREDYKFFLDKVC